MLSLLNRANTGNEMLSLIDTFVEKFEDAVDQYVTEKTVNQPTTESIEF
jgi:hypothetical protein